MSVKDFPQKINNVKTELINLESGTATDVSLGLVIRQENDKDEQVSSSWYLL